MPDRASLGKPVVSHYRHPRGRARHLTVSHYGIAFGYCQFVFFSTFLPSGHFMASDLRLLLYPALVAALWIALNLNFVVGVEGEADVQPAAAPSNVHLRGQGSLGNPRDTRTGPPTPPSVADRSYIFRAEKTGGTIRLGGFFPDGEARNQALSVLGRGERLGSLVDETALRPGAPAQFNVAVEAALTALARLSEGRVSVDERVVSVRGRSFYQKAALSTLKDVQGALSPEFRVDATIEVEEMAGPMNLSLCRSQVKKLLAGGVIRFDKAGAGIEGSSMSLLDPLVVLLRRCGQSGIGVHIVSPDVEGLGEDGRSSQRVRSLADYLGAEGLPASSILLDGEAPSAASVRDLVEIQVR